MLAVWFCALTTLSTGAFAQDDVGDEVVEPGAEGHVPPPAGDIKEPSADEVDPNAVGIMVRVLVAESEADPTTVLLKGADGTQHTIPVHDDGVDGDVDAGDRIWAGSIWLLGDAFDVTIDTAAGPVEAGSVSWSPDDKTRDLMISIDATQVSAEALVSKPPPAQEVAGDQGAEGAPGEPGAAGDPGAAPAGGPPGGSPPPPGGEADASGGGALRTAGLLFGLLALVALVWWWRQSSSSASDGPGTPRPEPPILGAGTPSLGDAVTVWSVSSDDAPALVGPLLATVARGRAVVVHAPGSFPIPPVHGGPVFAADDVDDLGDRVEGLVHTGALAAGFVVLSPATVEGLADVEAARPEGAAMVVLAIDPAEGVTGVACRRNGQRWVLGEVTVRPGPYGFEHPDLVDE